MGVTGPEDAVKVPMLASLIQDKTIRFSLWYPFQWPRTIGILAHNELDTGPIITHSASLDGIGAAIERVVNREEGVLKTVIKP
jgi:threonine dehydrogenase-like Zn-dependent dehydrogenase